MNYTELLVRSHQTKRNTEVYQCGIRKSDVEQIGGFDTICSKKKSPKSNVTIIRNKVKE